MQPANISAPTARTQPSTGNPPPATDDDDTIIYRGGSFNDTNFTPRPGTDDGTDGKSGLSTFTDPVKATGNKGGKAHGLSSNLLRSMGFILTREGQHVGIRPPTQLLLDQWAQSRSETVLTNPAQILTQMVKSAKVEEIRIPKTK